MMVAHEVHPFPLEGQLIHALHVGLVFDRRSRQLPLIVGQGDDHRLDAAIALADKGPLDPGGAITGDELWHVMHQQVPLKDQRETRLPAHVTTSQTVIRHGDLGLCVAIPSREPGQGMGHVTQADDVITDVVQPEV